MELHLRFGESVMLWRDEKNCSDLICRIIVTKNGHVKFVDKRY